MKQTAHMLLGCLEAFSCIHPQKSLCGGSPTQRESSAEARARRKREEARGVGWPFEVLMKEIYEVFFFVIVVCLLKFYRLFYLVH